jgi:hypothetical protein
MNKVPLKFDISSKKKFMDFKKGYDSLRREELCITLIEFEYT